MPNIKYHPIPDSVQVSVVMKDGRVYNHLYGSIEEPGIVSDLRFADGRPAKMVTPDNVKSIVITCTHEDAHYEDNT